ncbi:aliphatic sulfonate ABC transporter substrate-binding protein [Gulosibacter molinativorax]|uniref:Aliphatic sulfonate ABC transporter substrate-binding protein n=1 Tax=Gulosibacter molinativorax TaxID=256821 RepID=A0ABT7C704_9MICO|nr:aliphatic sulfonate ABC transporter substrate-binding protein [Gulosibacter molinativorax]MDJ1370988.1 aliphatic sulfonate ABC transporter substrate-binding protein [Gulosibacter molinativorax]QUY62780.1 Putative aliphatic sulfonates ABC transporter, substrate-binding protein SsuA [Gulosibacter molinativorax]
MVNSLRKLRRTLAATLSLLFLGGGLTACASDSGELTELNIDYATYSLLSLVVKDQGWLEAELEGVDVNWVFSAGSNKANEYLRSDTVDIATTGGGPAVQSRANGTPIKTIMLTHASEGYAFVVAEDSALTSVSEFDGLSVAATRGTDAYYFALQALELHGLSPDDVTLENMPHADGRSGLETGSVDAWAGIDPILAGAELGGAHVVYTNPELISPIFLNASESFIEQQPETVQLVVDTYERAREWVLANPDEAIAIYADEAGVEQDVAELTFERLDFGIDPVPDPDALAPTLETIGGYMVDSGDVVSQEAYDEALATMYDSQFIEAATSEPDASGAASDAAGESVGE